VATVVAACGRPLDTATRLAEERRFGHSFADVRVHDSELAAEAAAEIGAAAFTYGRHIAFGRRRFAPSRPADRALLRHELVHVLQQRGSEHAAPRGIAPARHPAEEEAKRVAFRHGAPSGGLSRVAAGLVQRQPRSEEFRLRPPELFRPRERPWLLQLPELHPTLTPGDIEQIDAFLVLHGFGLVRFQPGLDGAETTIDDIVDRLRPIVPSYIPRSEIRSYVERRHHALVLDALLRPRPRVATPPPPYLVNPPTTARESRAAPDEQLVVAAATNVAWHLDLVTGGPASPGSDVTMQFQVGTNVPHHREGAAGREEARFIQFSYNVTTGAVQLTAGLQETYVVSLFHNLLELGVFAQALAGVATGAATAAGVAQVGAGAQAMVQLGPISFGVTLGPSVTFTAGQNPTLDFGVGPAGQATMGGGQFQFRAFF
jgi:Domain of unknown function (DUF4157)